MQRSSRPFVVFMVIGLTLLVMGIARRTNAADDVSKFAKWEKSIAAFEDADLKQAPAKNGVVFVDSSSIRMWDVQKSFPDLPVINRGFGGSRIEDSVHFAERIVIPYQPRVVVILCR